MAGSKMKGATAAVAVPSAPPQLAPLLNPGERAVFNQNLTLYCFILCCIRGQKAPFYKKFFDLS